MSEQIPSSLYMPSTPLNLLLSVVMAIQKKETARLIYIDQTLVNHNPFIDVLAQWQQSPFEKVDILSGQAKGLAKLTERRANFAWLADYCRLFAPQTVWVGSDRRIEFQYVMHLLSTAKHQVKGVYLDDGLYSYRGKPTTATKHALSDWLHKLVYGFWWQEPVTVGASEWISDAWLFQPTQAVKALQHKHIKPIQVEWLRHPLVQEFALNLWQHISQQDALPNIDVLLLLPHPNNIAKMPSYVNSIKMKVQQWRAADKKVAVKYHPRSVGDDFLQLCDGDLIFTLPKALPTEVIYLMLPSHAMISADVGTAVFTARWLRPELTLSVTLNKLDPFQQSFLPLLEGFSIPVNKE